MLTVQDVLKQFEKDYDLSDMNANDELSLDNLARIFARLEKYEGMLDEAKDVTEIDRLTRITERLRNDASKIQTDLGITRKQRKSEKEANLQLYIDDIKWRAAVMLKDRLNYVYCPKCHMLLANIWFLYPDKDENVLRLRCDRTLDDSGEKCDNVFTVSSQELRDNKNKNPGNEEVLPT
jgi:hypothetical protein